MPWDRESQKHTLFIENHGTAANPKYKLGQFKRITTRDGVTYLEPMGPQFFMANYVFEELVIGEPIGTRRGEDAGERSLTHSFFPKEFGYRNP